MADLESLINLKGLRTLGASWDIDVGDLLEKYMDDVTSLVTDDPTASLSFPQAALIIKNSSTAYTRKVVALSKQVLQVSEDIVNGRLGRKRAGGALANVGDAPADAAAPLDDVVVGGANIDLPDENELEEIDEFDAICGADPIVADEMRESGFGRPAVTWAAVPAADAFSSAGSGVPLGIAADPAAEVHTFLAAVRATNDGAGFRMSMCPVDEAGALVVAGRASSFGRALGEVCEIDDADVAASGGEFGGSNDGDFDDFDDDGGGNYFDGESSSGAGGDVQMVTPTAAASSEAYALRNRDAASPTFDDDEEEEEEEEESDPWMLLDFTAAPLAPLAASSKLRKGHPFRLPRSSSASARARAAASRTASSGSADAWSQLLLEGGAMSSADVTACVRRSGLYFPELLHIVEQQKKLAAVARLEVVRNARATRAANRAATVATASSSAAAAVAPTNLGEGGEEYDLDGGGGDFEGENDDGFDYAEGGGGDMDLGAEEDDAIEWDGGDGAESLFDGLGNFEDDDGVAAGQTPRGAVAMESYHEMVQRHIRLWWHDAQRYERTSKLSQRVKAWDQRIAPLLAEEEKHSPFDIQQCGTGVIDTVKARAVLLEGRAEYVFTCEANDADAGADSDAMEADVEAEVASEPVKTCRFVGNMLLARLASQLLHLVSLCLALTLSLFPPSPSSALPRLWRGASPLRSRVSFLPPSSSRIPGTSTLGARLLPMKTVDCAVCTSFNSSFSPTPMRTRHSKRTTLRLFPRQLQRRAGRRRSAQLVAAHPSVQGTED